MKETSFYNDAALSKDQFKIDYPYYGLFGSAEITPIQNEEEVLYRCRLLNGTTIFLKKLFQTKKWIDAGLNAETPLSETIGIYIDDFLKIKKGA
jgi:hypothetical protein